MPRAGGMLRTNSAHCLISQQSAGNVQRNPQPQVALNRSFRSEHTETWWPPDRVS